MVEEGREADTDRGEADQAGGDLGLTGTADFPRADKEIAQAVVTEVLQEIPQAFSQTSSQELDPAAAHTAPPSFPQSPQDDAAQDVPSGVADISLFDLVDFLARNLVMHPEAVDVKQNVSSQLTSFELHVHKDDLGRVIGKQGRTAKSLRTILNAAASRVQQKASLEIIEE